jgi:DNA-binding response OmpR family regulator
LLSGADDYIAKPFDLAELEARIVAVMRRYKPSARPALIRVGDLEIDDSIKHVKVKAAPSPSRPRSMSF